MSKMQTLSAKSICKGPNPNKVVIQDNGPEKKTTPGAPTPKTEITAPPPSEGFKIKDEVEMLRAGFKNKHGEAVKTQGQTMNLEL
uniref:PEST proteolytic signal-containing nuclear protein n=2 Tax=Caenorhabditis tropicalis TaxID=1561998 RepID=A0A1I7T756_9PELO